MAEDGIDRGKWLPGLARYSKTPIAELEAALDRLGLDRRSEHIRFTDLVFFARDFGLDIRALAEFVVQETSGIKPWKPSKSPVEDAWRSLVKGDLTKAEARANKLLKDAQSRRGRWDQGNLIHHGNLITGPYPSP